MEGLIHEIAVPRLILPGAEISSLSVPLGDISLLQIKAHARVDVAFTVSSVPTKF